jgi:hypothetical protein
MQQTDYSSTEVYDATDSDSLHLHYIMHVAGTEEKKCIQIFLWGGKTEDKRQLGRPTRRWEKYHRILLIAWLGTLERAG